MAADMSIEIAGVKMKNPVMTASGTFGAGKEFSEFFDLNILGAIVTKGVSLDPWPGNPTPRICETPSGMLNSIGLQNPGIDMFVKRDLKFLEEGLSPGGTKVIVNICGHSIGEYVECAKRLSSEKRVDLLEVNISCPNVKEGGIAFGTDPESAFIITSEVKKVSEKPVIVKLSPNVTDIARIAIACEEGGADALSMINTLTGMKIDIYGRTFALANMTGGLSGPAIHPIAVRMVYQCARNVKIPIIGMGGIVTAEDAIEMIIAGASAVSVGTALFRDQTVAVKVIDGIEDYMAGNHVESISELIGCVR